MFSLLLAIIYMSFISLGLPDSLLGSGWPSMYTYIGVPVSYAGIISMIIAGGTIVSSLLSERLTKKFGAGAVTAVSVFMTAVALFGFSVSNSFVMLCFFSIPYGFGAGSVDAALNNYVALHYSSRHMSWLHCFWGVGAAISPYIMSFAIGSNMGWYSGYRIVSFIQIALTIVLFISLPMWKKSAVNDESAKHTIGIINAIKIRGVKYVMIAFFGYCALETTAGLWASSYLNIYKGVDTKTAALFASLFYIGITIGRFLCGFVADILGDRLLVRIGLSVTIFGIIAVMLPVDTVVFALVGLVVIGFGCAPIYPSIIHSTPANFGAENSQAIIGIQMASAYTGSTFMPPLFGSIASSVSIGLYPFFLMIFALLMIIMTELLNKKVKIQ